MKKFLLCLILGGFFADSSPSKIIRYDRDDLVEGSECSLSGGVFGICRKAEDCKKGFEQHMKSNKGIPVCNFAGTQSIICCPDEVDGSLGSTMDRHSNPVNLTFDYCKDNFNDYRLIWPDYMIAVVNGVEVDSGEFNNIVGICS